MKFQSFSRQSLAAITALVLLAGAICADEPATDAPPAKPRPSRTELRDKQYDVSLDARDIERILTRLKRASELSKQRIVEAAESAEGVATAIDRDPAAARARAEETAKMFQEIAKQLEALLTEETPQKVAAARNMANQLAKAEQQFAQQAKMMAKNMQSAPAAAGQGDGDAKPNPNTKPQGQGQRPKDPMDDPKEGQGGGSRPEPKEDENGKNGEKTDKDAPPKDPQGPGKNEGDPMPAENPAGTGDAPKDDADKNKNGKGEEKGDKDTEPMGTGAGKPNEENKDAPGTGVDGEKPEDKDDNKDQTGGGGADDKTNKPDEKRPAGGGGRTEKRPMTEEERREQLAGRAADLANRAATLLDILQSIAESQMPEDRTTAEKVNALLKETDLKNAIESMQAAADQVRNQKLEDAQATALDVADRFQITTQRLDAVYRALVGPQAEELRKLEEQLLQLRAKLEELETPAQVVAWHRAVRDLLDRAEELGISEKRREELLEEMKKNGINLNGPVNVANVQLTDGRYVAPTAYNTHLVLLQEEIQSRIQSLVLGDFASVTDDLAPPKYQSLVERYNQVLSRAGSNKTGEKMPSKAPAPSKDKK